MNLKQLLIVISIVFYIPVNGQITKFRTTYVSARFYDEEKNEWSEWREWEESNLLITENKEKQRITIYGKRDQHFDIINQSQEVSEEGVVIVTMNCLGYNESKIIVKFLLDDKDNSFLCIL